MMTRTVTRKIEQENDCRIVVDNSDNQGGTSQNNAGLSTDCSNFAANPDDVEEQSQVGQGQSARTARSGLRTTTPIVATVRNR